MRRVCDASARVVPRVLCKGSCGGSRHRRHEPLKDPAGNCPPGVPCHLVLPFDTYGASMCGIIGYSGSRQAAKVLMDGLATLEYRGYDSAGKSRSWAQTEFRECTSGQANSRTWRSRSTVRCRKAAWVSAHTRWATHGGPTDQNAHPHTDCSDQVVVVHNGIVENYQTLRRELVAKGHVFKSQTDSECIPHIIGRPPRPRSQLGRSSRGRSTAYQGSKRSRRLLDPRPR